MEMCNEFWQNITGKILEGVCVYVKEIASFLEFLESVRILMLYYTCIIVIALRNVLDFMCVR